MTRVLTAGEMRAAERAAIDSEAVTGLELMERAGLAAVDAILAEWPDLAIGPHRANILCGLGNNGGDGFVVARLLAGRGWNIEVFLYGDPEKLAPDARTNHDAWSSIGPTRPWPGPDMRHDPWACDLIVDALFGTGLTRPLSFDDAIGAMLPEWDLRHEPGRPRIAAIDMPSGLCSDSGRLLEGDGLWADLTVTFHTAKPGHFLAEGPESCGKIRVVDIGLPTVAGKGALPMSSASGDRWVLFPPRTADSGRADVSTSLIGRPALLAKRGGHKFDHGHALMLSGGVGRGGAARMAARGALRIGAGLVTVGCPPAALIENATQLNAIMLRGVKDADTLNDILGDPRITVLCLGPGLGTGAREAGLVRAALAGVGSKPPCAVLDGDALTLLAGDAGLFAMLHDRCVLTPHGGEFGRLFPDIADRMAEPAVAGPAYSKLDATRNAAQRAGCTVVFKGPDTVIADPDGRAAIHSARNDRAAPWLATAGAGDVLAGFIAGLLARGLAPMDAAQTAVWLHVECALAFGPGLIAEDLPETLPQVLRALG